MVNKKFREAVAKYTKDTGVTIQYIDHPALDNCIIGIIDGIAVYDYQKMLIELVKEMNGDKEAALLRANEVYNVVMSKPYEERDVLIGLGIETFIAAYNDANLQTGPKTEPQTDPEGEQDSVADPLIN